MKRLVAVLLSIIMILSASLMLVSAVDIGDDDLVYGDVDYDNRITAVDARLVLLYSVGSIGFDSDQKERADVNFDKNYDSVDAVYILQASVGLRSLGWGQIIF